MNRRNFISKIFNGVSLFFLFFFSSLYSFIKFLFPNVLYEPPSVYKIGSIDDIADNTFLYNSEGNFYVFRNNNEIFAISAKCTHLGCTVKYDETKRKFKCPCHGSIFKIDGTVESGPAPKPLNFFEIIISKNKKLIVNKAKKVSYEYRIKV